MQPIIWETLIVFPLAFDLIILIIQLCVSSIFPATAFPTKLALNTENAAAVSAGAIPPEHWSRNEHWALNTDPATGTPAAAALGCAASVLKALHALESTPGAETLRGMAATLLRACGAASRHLPDVLADASLVLYNTARPLLDGAYCREDKVGRKLHGSCMVAAW
jgi:hypothetical protein